MKTLKTKRINVVIAWNNIRLVPPKDIPTIVEMERTSEIFTVLEEAIPDFVELITEGETLRKELSKTGDLPEAEIKKANEDWQAKNKKWQQQTNALEVKTGDEIIEVAFENEQFNTFFQQCERWGKNWFSNIKEYLAFRADLNKTNAQPKEEKKGKK